MATSQNINGTEYDLNVDGTTNQVIGLTAGSSGGYVDISLTGGSSLFSSNSGQTTINISAPNNNYGNNFELNIDASSLSSFLGIFGNNVKYTTTYNGSVTKVVVTTSYNVGLFSSSTSTILTVNITGNPFSLKNGYSSSGSISGSSYDICFLKGAHIKSGNEYAAVESIKVGDSVSVFVDNKEQNDTVKWIGQAECKVRADLPDDKAGYPVRILKNAISEGVPFQDLLVTPEHCLFFEGQFIPARMLVNGRSIFYDKHVTSYEYYHIETKKHAVIMANGMLTESYLDTGNRSSFRNKNVYFLSNAKSWLEDAAAPLSTTPDAVEPIFRNIQKRAENHQLGTVAPERLLTQDPKVTLLTNTGLVLEPIREVDGNLIFLIAGDVQAVRVRSRASRPYDTIGPYWDDRRVFGVAISEVHIFEWNVKTAITSYRDVEDLDGWNALEQGADTRWTTGDALLPLNRVNPEIQAVLSLKVKAGTYFLDEEMPAIERLQA